jgi:mannose-6-phosphate isomerase-like protein (cupin superfamily)
VRRVVTTALTSGRSVVASDDRIGGRPGTPGILSGGHVIPVWGGDRALDPSFRVFTVPGSQLEDGMPENGMPENGMHATPTVDFVVVLSGEVLLQLDEQTVRLRAGDTLVQRGASHAWRSCGSATATIAVVMLPTGTAA